MAKPFHQKTSVFTLCACAYVAGIFMGTFFIAQQNDYAAYFGQKFAFQGTVVEEPSVKAGKVALTVQPAAGAFVSGNAGSVGTNEKILVTGFANQPFAYGDQVYVVGKILQPQVSADFDYPGYLAGKGIFAEVSYPTSVFVVGSAPPSRVVAWCLALKHSLFSRVEKLLPGDRSALAEAVLAGDTSKMSGATVQAFSVTGTAHFIAVSGYKLTLVLVSVEAAGVWVGRRTATGVGMLFSVAYLACSGFAPAVLRAVVMSTLFVLCRALGRRYALVPSLLVAALVILTLNPFAVRYDLGFSLSFVGILGIVYVGPIVERVLAPFVERLPHTLGIREIFISTTAAQVATAPLVAYSFHQVSFVAPLANFLIVPLLAPLIAAGYGVAVPVFGSAVAAVATFPLAYVLAVINWLASLPFAYSSASLPWWGMGALYAAEILGILSFNYFIEV